MSYERHIDAQARLHGFLGTRSADIVVRRRQAELFGTALAKEDQIARSLLGSSKTPPAEERFSEAYSKAVYALRRLPKVMAGPERAALGEMFMEAMATAKSTRGLAGKKADSRYALGVWQELEQELATRIEAGKVLAATQRLRGAERLRAAADAATTREEKAQRLAALKAEVKAMAADKEIAPRLAGGPDAEAWAAVRKAAGKWHFGGLPTFTVSTAYNRFLGTLIALGLVGGLVALALRFNLVGRLVAAKAPIDGWLRATYLSILGGDVERLTILAAGAHLVVFASWIVLIPLGLWRVWRARGTLEAIVRALMAAAITLGPYLLVVILFNVGIGR